MKCVKLHDAGARRALLFFAGWGMDPRPFEGLEVPGFDVWLAWDYTRLTQPQLPRYAEIVVVAWSYGATAAAWFMKTHPELPITLSAAICATLYPADDTRGIPEATVRGTLDGFSSDTLRRFRRRMCGSGSAAAEFEKVAPQRSVDDLRLELEAICRRGHVDGRFDVAFIGTADRIIPADNQRRLWQSLGVPTVEIDAPHLPPQLAKILKSLPVNKQRVGDSFRRGYPTYDAHAGVQRGIARRLASLLALFYTERRPGLMIEVGTGSGQLTRAMLERYTPQRLLLLDLNPPTLPEHPNVSVIVGDAETEICTLSEGEADMIVSSSAIQWFNSPERFVARAMRLLRPGGILAVTTYGPDNFRELGRALRYPPLSSYLAAAPDAEVLRADDSDRIVLDFDSPRKLIDHIRLTGVAGVSAAISPVALRRITTLTYHPLFIILRKCR